jgi:hypothetical protein
MSNKETIKLVEELSKNNGGSDFKWAESIEERKNCGKQDMMFINQLKL